MSEKPRSQTRRIIVILAVIAAVGIVIGGCVLIAGGIWVANNPLFSHTCFNGNRSQLEKFAHFSYPADASDIHEDCDIWQGANIKVWFEMDASDLDAFIASTLIGSPLTDGGTPPDFGPATNNHTLRHGEYVSSPGVEGGQTLQSIWVDVTNPSRFLVYLQYTEPD
jgi:hypothetical protein